MSFRNEILQERRDRKSNVAKGTTRLIEDDSYWLFCRVDARICFVKDTVTSKQKFNTKIYNK